MSVAAVTGQSVYDVINPLAVNFATVYTQFASFIDGIIAFAIFFSLAHWVFTKKFEGKEGKMVAIALGAALTFGFVAFEQISGFRFGGQQMQTISGILLMSVMGILLYTLFESMLGAERKRCALAGSYFITHSVFLGTFSPLYQNILQTAPIITSVLGIGYVIALVQVIMCLFQMIGGVSGNSGSSSGSSSSPFGSSDSGNSPFGGDNNNDVAAVEITEPLQGAAFILGSQSRLRVRTRGKQLRGAVLRVTAPSVSPQQGRTGFFGGFTAQLRHISPGEQTITVEALNPGGVREQAAVTINVIEGGTLEGVALDNTGVPVKDAYIRVVPPGSGPGTSALQNYRGDHMEARTNGEGRFTIQHVPFGVHLTLYGVSQSTGDGFLYIPRRGIGTTVSTSFNLHPSQATVRSMQVLFRAPLTMEWENIVGFSALSTLHRLATGANFAASVKLRGGTRPYTVVWQLERLIAPGGALAGGAPIPLLGGTITAVSTREYRASITIPAAGLPALGIRDDFYRLTCRVQDAYTPTPASKSLTADIEIGSHSYSRLRIRVVSFDGNAIPPGNTLPVMTYNPTNRFTVGIEVSGATGTTVNFQVAATTPGQPTILWTNTTWTPPAAPSTVGTLVVNPLTGAAQLRSGSQYDITVRATDGRGDTSEAQLTVLVSPSSASGGTTGGRPSARIRSIEGNAVTAGMPPVTVHATPGGLILVEVATTGFSSPTVEAFLEVQLIHPSTGAPIGGVVTTAQATGRATAPAGTFECDILYDASVAGLVMTNRARGIPCISTVKVTVSEGGVTVPAVPQEIFLV